MQKMAELPILYSFRRCPYAIRARMALHAAGVALEMREVALRSKPAALMAISSKATVPVLQLPDGQVIDESLDILFWALQHHDPQGWLTPPECARAPQWVRRCDEVFKPLLDRYKYAPRFPDLSQQAHRDNAMAVFVGPLETCLAARSFVGGAVAGWADVAIFPFIRQFAKVEPTWFDTAALSGVQRWLSYWQSSVWFAQAMVKQPLWQHAAADQNSMRRTCNGNCATAK